MVVITTSGCGGLLVNQCVLSLNAEEAQLEHKTKEICMLRNVEGYEFGW